MDSDNFFPSNETVPYNTTQCPRHGYSCLSEYYSALMMLQFGKTLGTKYLLMHFLCKNVLHQSGGGGKTSSSPSSFFIERMMRLLSLAVGGGVSCMMMHLFRGWCLTNARHATSVSNTVKRLRLVNEAMVSHPVHASTIKNV